MEPNTNPKLLNRIIGKQPFQSERPVTKLVKQDKQSQWNTYTSKSFEQ